ncbi:hypothetical protein [Pelosinus fermentans]|uniref:hypothetical protein n=1 Tax=Pelosinus fermentans TaxID=365349 RepID=UPI00190FFFB2|nr:hypothetical protein [Pelosinus fermentans]
MSRTIIATHMEALDHTTISRDCLRQYADAKGIRSEQLLIPSDGEMYYLPKISEREAYC